MNAYGTILAPIAAIFIADYFIVKHKRADIASLFKGAEGRYWYSGGFNVAAIIAWVLAFIFPLLTYFGVQGSFWTFINSINYVWSFVIGFVVYILLMKTSMAGNSNIHRRRALKLSQKELSSYLNKTRINNDKTGESRSAQHSGFLLTFFKTQRQV